MMKIPQFESHGSQLRLQCLRCAGTSGLARTADIVKSRLAVRYHVDPTLTFDVH